MFQMHRITLVLALLLPGCASVGRGFDVAQGGMAVVDVSVDRALEGYVKAVQRVRKYCQTQPGPKDCELELGVTDANVADVEAAAELMSEGYDETADGLQAMQAAWELLWPQIERVTDAANNLSRR